VQNAGPAILRKEKAGQHDGWRQCVMLLFYGKCIWESVKPMAV